MNIFSLSVSFGAAMIAVVAAAAVVLCVAIGAVVLYDRFAANKKTGKVTPKKEKKEKWVEEKPVQKKPAEKPAEEVKPLEEVKPAEVEGTKIEEVPEEVIAAEEEAAKTVDPAAEELTPPAPEVETAEVEPVQEEQVEEVSVEQPAEAEPQKTIQVLKTEAGKTFVRIRYNRSYTARLIQSDDAVKNYYSAVKNELKKYPLKERTSWRHETYRSGRKLIARLTVRGKTLCLYLATDPAKYAGTKYKVEDVSAKKRNAEVPARYRIKNERRMKYSAQIISDAMQAHGFTPAEVPAENYAAQYPYEELEPLIEKGLIKLLPIKEESAESEVSVLPLSEMLPQEVLDEASVTEAEEIIPEEEAQKLVEESKQPEKTVEVIKTEAGKILVRIRYNRSFTARLIQSDDAVKNYYSAVKNELKKYPLKERTSWKHETYRSGRKLIARLTVRGKTLCLYLATDPAKYAGTKYKVEDVSAKKRNAEVPALYRIKNERRMKYSAQIISDTMQAHGFTPAEGPAENYAAQYPYEELEPLIERRLVKLLPIKEESAESEVSVLPLSEMLPQEVLDEVSVTEAEEILPGEDVESLVEESVKVADKTKRGIVNIDALGKYFKKGETVTLQEIKKRVPGINKKTTYIKVLARGTLDKTLYVEADDFSPAAVKMIVLTGGKVTRTKSSK